MLCNLGRRVIHQRLKVVCNDLVLYSLGFVWVGVILLTVSVLSCYSFLGRGVICLGFLRAGVASFGVVCDLVLFCSPVWYFLPWCYLWSGVICFAYLEAGFSCLLVSFVLF